MKDIILKIKDNDGIEFVTEGRLYSRGSTRLIQYDETELSGMEGCTTSLTITPKRVRMKRTGHLSNDVTEMIFEKGRRMHGLYATPYGNVGMEILTNSISGLDAPSDYPGKLSIDYSISLKGLYDARKRLDIEYKGKGEPVVMGDDPEDKSDIRSMLTELTEMFSTLAASGDLGEDLLSGLENGDLFPSSGGERNVQ